MGGRAPGPVCIEEAFTSVDDGLVCIGPNALPGPIGNARDYDYLRAALEDMAVTARNFGAAFIKDSKARANYVRKIEQMTSEVLRDVRDGRATAEEGAEFARNMRNAIMEETRLQSSSMGKAAAQAMKASGKSLTELFEDKVRKLFPGKSYIDLAKGEREEVFEAIIESAGRSRPSVTALIPRWRLAGRGCLFFAVAIGVYNVWTAENKIQAGLSEILVFGGGVAGGAIAGAATGLVCGPGAPFCSTALFLVGGFMGALAAQAGVALYDEELREFSGWLGDWV